MKNVTLIKVCTQQISVHCVAEEIGNDNLKLESEFHVLCRKIIRTQILILLSTEQVDEDGSLVGSLFWFSWETCWYVSKFDLNHGTYCLYLSPDFKGKELQWGHDGPGK